MSKKDLVVVSMPAFNEGSSILHFLEDLLESFSGLNLSVVVVNDFSSDSTGLVLEELAKNRECVYIIHNERNLGHGASTLLGLNKALSLNADYILTTDGDGNVIGSELHNLLNKLIQGGLDVVEGVRSRPNDKWFRKAASLFTRFLVWKGSGSFPKDANTPFRAYTQSALQGLIRNIPSDFLVPNLYMSEKIRREGLHYSEEPISEFFRKGTVKSGTTWGQRGSFLPSKSFLLFCINSIRQWMSRSS